MVTHLETDAEMEERALPSCPEMPLIERGLPTVHQSQSMAGLGHGPEGYGHFSREKFGWWTYDTEKGSGCPDGHMFSGWEYGGYVLWPDR